MINDSLITEKVELPSKDGRRGSRIPQVRFPLRAKITVPFLILAVGLAISAAYVITQIVFDTIDERYTNQLIESGKLAAEGMVRQEDNLLRSLRLFSYAEGIPEAVEAEDIERIKGLSLGITVNQGDEMVSFLDKDGQLVLSLTHLSGGSVADYEYSTSSEFEYSRVPFIRAVLQERVDELGDKFSGLVDYSEIELFYVAGPIYNNQGEFSGAVLVGKTLDSLLRQIHDETLAQVTVYNSSGLPFGSTFFEPPELEISEAETVLANQDQGSFTRNIGSRRGLNISNIEYEEILGPWEGRGNEDLGLIGVSLPRTFLVRASNATRIQITGLATLMLLFVLLLGVYIASIITRPLRNLAEASKEVADGNLHVQVEPKGHDEVTVLTRSFNTMVSSLNQSKLDLLNAYDRTLEGWSMALELRDQETEGHTRRVAEMTIDLAVLMGFEGDDLVNIRRGALLHDIGKMGIPDKILLKPGKLTPEEWVIMRKHPEFAYELIWPIEYLRPAIPIPHSHHEWWDGTGYPLGLAGEDIPLPARIFAVIDVWDAMSSDRPYRKALPEIEVWEYLVASQGVHFDPRVVEAFFELLAAMTESENRSSESKIVKQLIGPWLSSNQGKLGRGLPFHWGGGEIVLVAILIIGILILGSGMVGKWIDAAGDSGTLPVSLHSLSEADYSVDEITHSVPAIGLEIIRDLLGINYAPEIGGAPEIAVITPGTPTPTPIATSGGFLPFTGTATGEKPGEPTAIDNPRSTATSNPQPTATPTASPIYVAPPTATPTIRPPEATQPQDPTHTQVHSATPGKSATNTAVPTQPPPKATATILPTNTPLPPPTNPPNPTSPPLPASSPTPRPTRSSTLAVTPTANYTPGVTGEPPVAP
jgi:HD-GYP domain-containing protein (c-di-GMP phosphodiesterase class II)